MQKKTATSSQMIKDKRKSIIGMNKVFFITLRRQRIGYKMKIYRLKYHWCQNENHVEKTHHDR